MPSSKAQIEDAQRKLCAKYAANYVASPGQLKSGFAKSTEGLIPINGLRHPIENGTTGWNIWCGEAFSDATGFFVPLHTYHLYDYPGFAHLLGLEPGYRFLLAGDYLDVWYDGTLLLI